MPQYPEGSVTATVEGATSPNVMDQFNAIRQKLTGQQPAVETVQQPVAQQVDPTALTNIKSTYKFDDGTVDVVGYSRGEPKSQAEFDIAKAIYDKVGNRKSKDFVFLEPGIVEKVRSSFESGVGGPLRQAATTVEGMPQMTGGSPGSPNPLAPLLNLAKGIIPPIAREVATPEGAGALAGSMAVAPAAKGLHVLSQALVHGAAAGGGSLAADIATGSNNGNPNRRAGNFLQQVALVSSSQGLMAGFKHAIGQGFSRKAQEQSSGDLMELLKKEAAPLVHDPNGLKIYGSSKKGANDIIQVGVKALRGDSDDIAADLTTELVSQARGLIKVENVEVVRKHVRSIVKLQTKLLDTVGSEKEGPAFDKVREEILENVTSIKGLLFKDISSAPNQLRRQMDISSVLSKEQAKVESLIDTAQVFHYMKLSVGPRGFDPTMMQKLVQYNSRQNPGSVLDKAGEAVFRGAKDRAVATDEPIVKGLPFGKALAQVPGLHLIPGIDKLNISKEIGMRYVGKVRGSYPRAETAARQATVDSIRSFLEEK